MFNKTFIKNIVITSIYIILCYIFSFISFGPIQLRISEILCLLTIENPIFLIGIVIGCFISNLLLSPLGTIDAIVGTLATIIGCLCGYAFRKTKYKNFPLLSAIIISLVNAIIVAIEIKYVLGNSNIFIYSFLEILLGELVVLVVIGYPIYNKLLKIINHK